MLSPRHYNSNIKVLRQIQWNLHFIDAEGFARRLIEGAPVFRTPGVTDGENAFAVFGVFSHTAGSLSIITDLTNYQQCFIFRKWQGEAGGPALRLIRKQCAAMEMNPLIHFVWEHSGSILHIPEYFPVITPLFNDDGTRHHGAKQEGSSGILNTVYCREEPFRSVSVH